MADSESLSTPVKRRPLGPLVILIMGTIFFVWLLLIFMSRSFYDDFGFDMSKDMWKMVGAAVMIMLIIILLLTGFSSKTPAPEAVGQFTSMAPATQKTGVVITSTPAGAGAASAGSPFIEAEPLVVEAEIIEVEPIEVEELEQQSTLKMQKPRLVEYPKKVPGGVYGDTIIRVDPLTKLNLRILLVRSCLICERQGKCWDEFLEVIPRDEFLNNIECKKGLRRFRGKEGGASPKKPKKRETGPDDFSDEAESDEDI